MSKVYKVLIIGVFISSIITSCGKKATNKELLIDKQWTLIKSEVEPALRGSNDFSATVGECIFDDVETYHANGEYTWDRGENVCDGEQDQERISKGTWTINEDMSEITVLDEEDYPFIFKIESINDSIMVVTHIEESDKSYTFKDTYKLK